MLAGGGAMLVLSGVHWAYFASVGAGVAGLVAAVFASRGQEWQILTD